MADWYLRDRVLPGSERTLIMGVLNVTPDSFSDAGRFLDPGKAIEHGRRLVAEGADLIDVGGESTRPGAEPVSEAEELRRVIPVVSALADAGVSVSIDTSKPVVAGRALSEGAQAVNDVTALGDPAMAEVVAAAGAGLVLMHMQGTPRTMQDDPSYEDVVADVRDFLLVRAAGAEDAGIGHEKICIDPGIGFGKTRQHNLELLRRLEVITATGYPVLVGTSRKSFLGWILDEPDPAERDIATAATVAIAAVRGASVVRVHNVGMARQAVLVADAIERGDNA